MIRQAASSTFRLLPASYHLGFQATRSFASVGDKIPSVELMKGFPNPENINMAKYCAGRSIIIVGLPGAFTPTWSNKQVPSYKGHQDALREVGVQETIVYCVNDPAVMQAWAKDQKIGLSKISFMGDPAGIFTKSLDMEMTDPGPPSVGIIGRCKRFALHAVDGEIKHVAISEGPNDPAGDGNPTATLAEAMINSIKG